MELYLSMLTGREETVLLSVQHIFVPRGMGYALGLLSHLIYVPKGMGYALGPLPHLIFVPKEMQVC